MAVPSTSGSAAGRELLQQLSRLIDGILAIDFQVFDEPGALAVAATTVPTVFDLAGLALTLLDRIQDHYEDLSEDDLHPTDEPESIDDIGALISTTVATHEVRDLAFIASGQLRSCLGRLQAAYSTQSLLNMVSGADDALTRLHKDLIPVEIAMGEYEGVTPPERVWINLSAILEARRLYGLLRRELLAVGEPADNELAAQLAEVADRLSNLRASQIFTYLRINDRVHIRSLHRRILDWLTSENGEPSLQAGRMIWLELCTLANLLSLINKRQELQEHDRGVIAASFHALYANVRPPTVIPADILEQLRSLEGLDEELDRLILHAATRDPRDWEAPIRRLWAEGNRPDIHNHLPQTTPPSRLNSSGR